MTDPAWGFPPQKKKKLTIELPNPHFKLYQKPHCLSMYYGCLHCLFLFKQDMNLSQSRGERSLPLLLPYILCSNQISTWTEGMESQDKN